MVGEAVRGATNSLRTVKGISKLVLFGSVARGEANPHDIDLAIIIDDALQNEHPQVHPPGWGYGICERAYIEITSIITALQQTYGIRFDTPLYYEREFAQGIEIGTGCVNNPPALLNDVGVLLYDTSRANLP